jgi:hypothetical protein
MRPVLKKLQPEMESTTVIDSLQRGSAHFEKSLDYSVNLTARDGMEYLGQNIEIFKDRPGWIASWNNDVGVVQIGFFQTPVDALDAIIKFIQHDLVLRSLLSILDDWRQDDLIVEEEYTLMADSLIAFTLNVDV